jgi:hypothetical protein
MTRFSCADARRRIQALHDGELALAEQVAVTAHLERCQRCAGTLADLRLMQVALRAARLPGLPLSRDDNIGFLSTVVSRAYAEEQLSFRTRIREMFDDMHFAYAGLGAVAAAMVCSVILLGMTRLATSESPDALAAMLPVVSAPGSNENPVSVGARVSFPRALDDPFATFPMHADDALFALAGVVTREGRAQHLELLTPNVDPAIVMDVHEERLVDDLIGVLAEARFEPASRAGLPVAVNMIWIVAHTTVRGTREAVDAVPEPPVPPVPPATKQTA